MEKASFLMNEIKTLYIQLKQIKSEKYLERLAYSLIKDSYPEYSNFNLLTVYLYEFDIKKPFAILNYRNGKLNFVSFVSVNSKESIGKTIGYKLSDLEPEYRFKEVKRYLNSGYIQGLNFQYVRVPFTSDIIEKVKLSDKINSSDFKAVKGINDNEQIEEGYYHIQKGSEFSKEFNDLYLLRLESPELVGFNEIHISRDIFTQCINTLEESLFIALSTMMYPAKVLQGLEKKQRVYIKTIQSNNGHNTKFRMKNKAITALIDNIISME